MNELKEIYDRITFLRKKGVKMKEMAEQTQLTPSVLSAMYSTVFPTYFKNVEKGMDEDDALDNALIWVNNLSKKKFLGSLPQMKQKLFSIDLTVKEQPDGRNPFLDELEQNSRRSVNHIANYSGIYTSYSLSSSTNDLKIEPYLIAPAENGNYIEVGHTNAHGTTHWGFGMMNGMSHLYLAFNESQSPQLSMFNICLKLPLFDRPPFLRGIYQCFDYNFNPIARRILLVKQTDDTDHQKFLQQQGVLKPYEELDETELLYYNYTCREGDVIRMCNIPTPRMNSDDLALEKKILELTGCK
ncbi:MULTISPECIES: hypothetical protein [Bacteroides]|jgi:lambda repressor-like predicted transcriptional regulator|uniref:hypothetical protein n=1 Tax=Bacteroides TaxID=816 RepID=UPI000C767929|nr:MULTISPECIES: hypothetical protein [Bacteroides]RGM44592.1 hypothetical protein DXC10_15380 [Bacteroides sp. OM08-11]